MKSIPNQEHYAGEKAFCLTRYLFFSRIRLFVGWGVHQSKNNLAYRLRSLEISIDFTHIEQYLGDRLVAGHQTLDLSTQVRILVPQFLFCDTFPFKKGSEKALSHFIRRTA